MKVFMLWLANFVSASVELISRLITKLFRVVILWPAFISGLVILFIASLYLWKGPDALTSKYASEADSYRSVLAGHILVIIHETPLLSPLTREELNTYSKTRTEKVLTLKEAAEGDLLIIKIFWLFLIVLGVLAEAIGLAGRGRKKLSITHHYTTDMRKCRAPGEDHE